MAVDRKIWLLREMTNVEDILTNPTTGLLPYLESRLSVDWNRFQLRNWSFIATEDNRSGYRLREGETIQDEWDKYITSWTITLGRVLSMDDAAVGQIQGGRFREELDKAIIHWSSGVCPSLAAPVGRITGMNDIEQNPRVSSGDPGAWNIVVVREFEFSYYLDYQPC